jgi:hypothetical protein
LTPKSLFFKMANVAIRHDERHSEAYFKRNRAEGERHGFVG